MPSKYSSDTYFKELELLSKGSNTWVCFILRGFIELPSSNISDSRMQMYRRAWKFAEAAQNDFYPRITVLFMFP